MASPRSADRRISTLSHATICRRSINGRTCCSTASIIPDELNAAVELTDRMVERGFGDHVALIGNGRRRTYKELSDWTNRIAHALVEDYRHQARQSRADPLRQQPGHGGVLAGGDQSGRGGRQHDADAARRRAGQDRRQGGNRRSRSATRG